MSKTQTFPNKQQEVKSSTCGPYCLLNIYTYFKIPTSISKILKELNVKKDENSHLAQLARHLHKNRLYTTIITSCSYNVSPEWKNKNKATIIENLKKWLVLNTYHSWATSTLFLLFYLQEGGNIKIVDLTTKIIDDYLDKNGVILTNIDESWLWEKRKIKDEAKYDSIRGYGHGHSVVIYGKKDDKYLISDPYPTGIKGKEGLYSVNKDKLLVSILLWGKQFIFVKK